MGNGDRHGDGVHAGTKPHHRRRHRTAGGCIWRDRGERSLLGLQLFPSGAASTVLGARDSRSDGHRGTAGRQCPVRSGVAGVAATAVWAVAPVEGRHDRLANLAAMLLADPAVIRGHAATDGGAGLPTRRANAVGQNGAHLP